MENLQCLTFNFDLQSLILHLQAGVRRLALRDFLDFVSTNSSALQHVSVLKIFLTFDRAAMYAFSLPETSTTAVYGSLGGPADWAEFDQLLTKRRSSNSGPCRVELALEVFEDTEPIFPAAVPLNVIREQMPLAVQSGVLVCEDRWYIRNEQQAAMAY
ncbi:hypothetical protein Hypma_003099 [Hypsizygus marmoreus]|uniref:Uncharacterized protein n=1 Tax=Hypsizygus marmoreus TaxID=39966 RepID=A0A369J4V6_HYPMA|nr:hypothetical protein Hypma_003099 [Hypsizygus marmoreus]